MNINTISVECAYRKHSQCTYEDCACDCHLRELIEQEQVMGDERMQEEELWA